MHALMSIAVRRDNALLVSSALMRADVVVYTAIGAIGLLLSWLCKSHVSLLPFWAPWDFSWVEFLCAWVGMWWYIRGLALTPPQQRSSRPRQFLFFAGVLASYAVLETRFEYYAQHQFFINRAQQLILHDIGPMLIALAWPGAELIRGVPEAVRRAVRHPAATTILKILRQPLIATFLFVGLYFFWLVPAVHFRAMIDPDLYAVMNWSMVADGLLFWRLVLDPRPSPPAPLSFPLRILLAVAIMFPQTLGGAVIALTTTDLYTFYDLCGRIYPNLGANYDQALGGMIIWIPPAMMSMFVVLIVMNTMRRETERSSDHEVSSTSGSIEPAAAAKPIRK